MILFGFGLATGVAWMALSGMWDAQSTARYFKEENRRLHDTIETVNRELRRLEKEAPHAR